MTAPCPPCSDGEHADDGTGAPCPCCGAAVPIVCRHCKQTIEPDDADGWRHTADGVIGCGLPFVDSELYAEPDSTPSTRLEYLRGELRAERLSYGELAELQSLAPHIDPGDVELLEAAGVPEYPEED